MKFAIVVPTVPGFSHSQIFAEMADTLQFGLTSLGYDSVISADPNTPGRRQIVLAAHMALILGMRLAPDAIIYNLEQIENNTVLDMPAYLALLREHVVWDYSEANVRELAKAGIAVNALLPIGYAPCLTHIKKAEQDIDVLFFGTMSPRRGQLMEALQFHGLQVGCYFGLYGAQRDALIGRAKLMLNVHMQEARVLEIVRISYYLANRCTVLSERGANPGEAKAFEGGVAFADYSQIPARAVELCRKPADRRKIAEKGFALMKSRKIEAYLAPLIAALQA